MYTVTVTNSRGQTLTLTQQEYRWQIVSITGLNPPPVELYNSIIAGLDGARINWAYMNTRNIVITLALKGNIETNRQTLYGYFRTKEKLTFYFKNQHRNVHIDGIVNTCEVDLYTFGETMQISIVCAKPLFIGTRHRHIFNKDDRSLFHFPFAISAAGVPLGEIGQYKSVVVNYEGDAPTGATIRLTATGEVTNPSVVDKQTGEGFYLQDITLEEGDVITIDTESGSRSVTGVIDGAEYSLFNNIDIDRTTWIQLQVGMNEFFINAESGDSNLDAEFEYNLKYEGV